MGKIILIVGLPASGKSQLSLKLAVREDAVILSSDLMREELFGDRRCQIDNAKVFQEMNNRLLKYLSEGRTVIYDATNINSKRRRRLLASLPSDTYKECVYVSASNTYCKYKDSTREFAVGAEIIDKMYKGLQVPMYHEGWDNIIIHTAYPRKEYDTAFNKPLTEKITFEEAIEFYEMLGLDTEVIDIPQDTYHHTFTVLKHCYYTYEWLFDNYFGEDRDVMLISALLHDISKFECKEFLDGSRYATFRGHDSITAQNVLGLLVHNGFGELFSLKVATIIQMHMRLSYNNDEKVDTSLNELLGDKLFYKMQLFRIADKQAK